MKSKWESRERKVRRIALVVSVLLHVFALALISTGTGGESLQNLIENVLGHDQPIKDDLVKTKV